MKRIVLSFLAAPLLCGGFAIAQEQESKPRSSNTPERKAPRSAPRRASRPAPQPAAVPAYRVVITPHGKPPGAPAEPGTSEPMQGVGFGTRLSSKGVASGLSTAATTEPHAKSRRKQRRARKHRRAARP